MPEDAHSTPYARFEIDGNALLNHLDPTPPTLPKGICRHCREAIVFEPYGVGTIGEEPSVWCHVGGGRACTLSDWPAGKRWPIAEPKEES